MKQETTHSLINAVAQLIASHGYGFTATKLQATLAGIPDVPVKDLFTGTVHSMTGYCPTCGSDAYDKPSTVAFTREDAAKIIERKAKALTDEYCHGDTGPGGYTWSNKEAEWQVILLEELAEEFRNGV